ncbi:MAG: helix-turn-helix domain-containing protein [Clostridia bacterium]|nr:helix-turn-helix domain-containing protein [Clostridia bacterium]
MSITERILERLQKSGKTQHELAVKLGISPNTISAWKQGKSKPSIDDIEEIADFLGCSVEYLITGRSEEPTIIQQGIFGDNNKNNTVSSKNGNGVAEYSDKEMEILSLYKKMPDVLQERMLLYFKSLTTDDVMFKLITQKRENFVTEFIEEILSDNLFLYIARIVKTLNHEKKTDIFNLILAYCKDNNIEVNQDIIFKSLV